MVYIYMYVAIQMTIVLYIYSNGQLVDGLPSPVDIYPGIYAIYGMNISVDEHTWKYRWL